MNKNFCQRFRNDETGSGLVEFAVSFTVLFVAIFLIFDASKLLYYNHFVAMAARDGSRYAMVRGTTWAGTSCSGLGTLNCVATSQNVTSRILASAPSITNLTPLTVATTWPGTTATGAACYAASGVNSPGCVVQVTVTYSLNTMVPFLPSSLLKLSSTSITTISQ